MCDCDHPCLAFWIISLVISVGVGVPCWAVGAYRPYYYTSGVLTAVPIFSIDPTGTSYYIGTKYNATATYYSMNNLSTLSIPLYYADFDSPQSKYSFYMIHNIWGAHIDLAIVDQAGNQLMTKKSDINFPNSTNTTRTLSDVSTLPDDFFTEDYVNIRCPLDTTYIIEQNLSGVCNTQGGYPMMLRNKYTMDSIGQFTMGKAGYNAYAIFSNLTVIPSDYVYTPEIYIGSWVESDSKVLTIIGAVFTGEFIVSLIIGILVLTLSDID